MHPQIITHLNPFYPQSHFGVYEVNSYFADIAKKNHFVRIPPRSYDEELSPTCLCAQGLFVGNQEEFSL